MKLRTNLSPDELETVSKSLANLALSRRLGSGSVEPVQAEVSVKLHQILTTYTTGLQQELVGIIFGEST